MKYFLLFLFLPLFSLAQSNSQLLVGQWVKAKAQTKDGSRIVDYNGCGMDFVKYSFADNGMVDMIINFRFIILQNSKHTT